MHANTNVPQAQRDEMASAVLKPQISKTLGTRQLILGIATEAKVVYFLDVNKLFPVRGHGRMYN